MAGIPWEPDLADVLEAHTHSIHVDHFNTEKEDGSSYASETVQALLMLNDSFEGVDVPSDSQNQFLPECDKEPKIEELQEEKVDLFDNTNIMQEIQLSDSLLTVTQSNTKESIVCDSESRRQGVIQFTSSYSTDSDDVLKDLSAEQITVVYSTLGQEIDTMDQMAENEGVMTEAELSYSTTGETVAIDDNQEKNSTDSKSSLKQPEEKALLSSSVALDDKHNTDIESIHEGEEEQSLLTSSAPADRVTETSPETSVGDDLFLTNFDPLNLETTTRTKTNDEQSLISGSSDLNFVLDMASEDKDIEINYTAVTKGDKDKRPEEYATNLDTNEVTYTLTETDNTVDCTMEDAFFDGSAGPGVEEVTSLVSPVIVSEDNESESYYTKVVKEDEDKSPEDNATSLDTTEVPDTLTTVDCTMEEAFFAGSTDPEDEEVASLTSGATGQYVVYGGDGSKYIISESPVNQCVVNEAPSLEEQMRALHGPSPELTPPPTITPVAAPDLLSLVVQETIPLRLDLTTGEMVPDVEAGRGLVPHSGAWVTPRQEEVYNIISESLEVFPQDDSKVCRKSPLKKSGSDSSVKKGSNIATVKPFTSSDSKKSSKSSKPTKILTSPIKLKAVLTSSPTPSSTPRPPSSVKCQCARHMVIGYPPAKVFYWTVGTTPGINSTYMDFDNTGVKFLYDEGDLRSFQAVLSSFKPEFLSTERSLEVSLCLSCVRWAENEFKSLKDKRKAEVERKKKEKEKMKLKAAKKEVALSSDDETKKTYKSKFKCVLCKITVTSPNDFKIHVKEVHQTNAIAKVESKRSSTSSKCKCLSHIDIFHGYSFMDQPPVTFRMNFSKTEESSLALRFYRDHSMLADTDHSLLCSFCVHFANQQVDKTRPKSPTKKILKKKGPLPSISKQKKQESSSSDSSSSDSSSSDSEDDDNEPELGACDVPGCKAVLKSPSALASHMKNEHPGYQKKVKYQRKYKSGVIKPVRVDLRKLSKEEINSLTSSTLTVAEDAVKETEREITKIIPDDKTNIDKASVKGADPNEDAASDVSKFIPEDITVSVESDKNEATTSKEEVDDNQNIFAVDPDTSMVNSTAVSIRNPEDEVVATEPEEETPILSVKKQKALDALKIDMVSDTFSPGTRRRTSRNENNPDPSARKTPPTRIKRKSGDSTCPIDKNEIEKSKSPTTPPVISGQHILQELQSNVEEECATPVTSRRKEINVDKTLDLIEEVVSEKTSLSKSPTRSGKPGKTLLKQLKMDMVVDSVLPTRPGKRRAERDLNQKAKKAKITPVDEIPNRHNVFAFKSFARIRDGHISKSEGYNVLERRVLGLTHVAFGKEYSRWVRENPATDDNKIVCDDPNDKCNKNTSIPESPKKMSINLTNVLTSEDNYVKKELHDTYSEIIEKKLTISEAAKNHSMNFSSMLKMFTNYKKGKELSIVDKIRDKYKSDRQRRPSGDNQAVTVERLQFIKEDLVNILAKGDLKVEETKLLKEIRQLLDFE